MEISIEEYFITPFDNTTNKIIEEKLLNLGLLLSDGKDIFRQIEIFLEKVPGEKHILKQNIASYICYLRNGNCIKNNKKDRDLLLKGKSLEKIFHNFLMELMMRYMRPNNTEKKHYLKSQEDKITPENTDCPTIIQYTEKEIKETNRWAEITLDNFDLMSDKEIYYPGDLDVIRRYNQICDAKHLEKSQDYKYRLNINPEPFTGNILKAKLIILSLNPGYVDKCNRLATILLKKFPKTYGKIKEFKFNSLQFKENYFELTDETIEDGIKYREGFNLIGDFYWHDKLMKLTQPEQTSKSVENIKLPTAEDVFQKTALIQLVPYQSNRYDTDFPNTTVLPSQIYTLKLLSYLYQKGNTKFLILRSEELWKKTLGRVYEEMESNKKILHKKSSTNISQCITSNNLGEETYNNIINILNSKDITTTY